MGMHIDPATVTRLEKAGQIRETTRRKGKAKKPKVKLLPASFRADATENGYRLQWVLPLRVDTPENRRGKWGKIGAANNEKLVTGRALARQLDRLDAHAKAAQSGLPVKVTLTRLGGRGLDSDAVSCFKYVRDIVALFCGVDDSPKGPIVWVYASEPGSEYGVRIETEIIQ